MIKEYYYISNIDGEVHKASDVKHSINTENATISILDEEGCEIDLCSLYGSIDELMEAVKHG